MTDLSTPTHTPATHTHIGTGAAGPITGATAAVGGITITGLADRVPADVLRPVAVDLYRDIHKGIRSELFDTTLEAGRLDPADRAGRACLAARIRDVVSLLESHAHHEDGAIEPVLEVELPALADAIAADHAALDVRIRDVAEQASGTVEAPDAEQRFRVHALYLELADFTSAYLRHQDLEERVVMPALEAAIGPEQVLAIHTAIVSSIPPDEMGRSLALMIPAMNVDDRVELLGGMRQTAPPEAFAGVWSMVATMLEPAAHLQLARRLALG